MTGEEKNATLEESEVTDVNDATDNTSDDEHDTSRKRRTNRNVRVDTTSLRDDDSSGQSTVWAH